MISRKASITMAFVILLGLVVAAVLFPVIGKFFFKIVGLITNSERDARARSNLDLLEDRIVFAQDQKISSSVLLDMPTNYVLFGFSKNVDAIVLNRENNWFRDIIGGSFLSRGSLCGASLERPSLCGDSVCLCAYHLESGAYDDANKCQHFEPRLAGCMTVDNVNTLRGAEQRVGMESRLLDAEVSVSDPTIFAFSSIQGPRNVKIRFEGEAMILDATIVG